jgi:hypothetical protein
MTLPEELPDPSLQSAEAAHADRFRPVEAIDADSLDKENKGWVMKYLDQLKTRIASEQAADQPDFVMISYLKRELATYQELVDRTEK